MVAEKRALFAGNLIDQRLWIVREQDVDVGLARGPFGRVAPTSAASAVTLDDTNAFMSGDRPMVIGQIGSVHRAS